MAQFFEMPQASPTMEKGLLLSWLKAEGDTLAPQDAIAEVETDKAAMEIEVFDSGVLIKILAAAGDAIPAGQPIAILGQSMDEDISGLLADFEAWKANPPAAQAAEPDAPTPAAQPGPAPASAAPKAPVTGTVQASDWMGKTLSSAIMESPGTFLVEGPRVRSSPLARKLAAKKNISLEAVTGTGPHGRIVKADVESWRPPAGGVAVARGQDQLIPNNTMRKTIARRLTESHSDSPVFFLTAHFDCDRFVAYRKRLKALVDQPISYNDLLMKCVARALVDEPACNASWSDDAITRFGSVDLGMAVALDGGLITPIIRSAESKSIGTIAAEARELAGRARSGKLKPDEYTGNTFTVSNLGMMDISEFTAIINPPASAILAVGSLAQEPVVVGGELSVGWRMRVTMTCDHRVIDGALGARYLQALRRYVENPELLAV